MSASGLGRMKTSALGVSAENLGQNGQRQSLTISRMRRSNPSWNCMKAARLILKASGLVARFDQDSLEVASTFPRRNAGGGR